MHILSSKQIVGAVLLGLIFLARTAEFGCAETPDGFASLFNGENLTGWKGLAASPIERAKISDEELAIAQAAADERMREHWHVAAGVIECDGQGDNLCTEKDYGDFEMVVDWKIQPQGDSGIYLRGTPQVQIWDTTYRPYWKHGAEKGSGALWNNKRHSRFPLVNADNPLGEWNTFYIKMVGDRVTVKLNGQLVVDNVVMENYWNPDAPIASKGAIELQSHDSKLWFKNLYIRELPAGSE